MKTIKSTTKQGENFVNAYKRSNYYTLRQVYGRFSWEKEHAEYNCINQMNIEGGEGFRILSANTFQFTCGWMTAEGLRVETACNSYLIAE